jgi:hypothetical protein
MGEEAEGEAKTIELLNLAKLSATSMLPETRATS